jgi:hypothetical protein
MPETLDQASIEILARYQVQKWISGTESQSIGGRLIMAELTRLHTTILDYGPI